MYVYIYIYMRTYMYIYIYIYICIYVGSILSVRFVLSIRLPVDPGWVAKHRLLCEVVEALDRLGVEGRVDRRDSSVWVCLMFHHAMVCTETLSLNHGGAL